MKSVFTSLGVAFCIAFIAGACVPGLEFHMFFGTESGAAAWHQELAHKEKSK